MWLSTDRNGGSDKVEETAGLHRPRPADKPLGSAQTSEEILLMTHEHDTVVVDDSGDSGIGAMLGVIAIIVLLAAVWFFALGPGSGSSTTNNTYNNNGGGTTPTVTQPALPAPSA
jgi:hypothetical protein